MKLIAMNRVKGVVVKRLKARGKDNETFDDTVANPGEVFECTGEDKDEVADAEARLLGLGVALKFEGKDSDVPAPANNVAEATQKNRARLMIKQAKADKELQDARDAAKNSDQGVGVSGASDNDSDKQSDAKKKGSAKAKSNDLSDI